MFNFTNGTTETLDKCFQMDTIYEDYSKAFDEDGLGNILKKLYYMGIK